MSCDDVNKSEAFNVNNNYGDNTVCCDNYICEDEVLHKEKSAMRISLTSLGLSKFPGICRIKNSEDSAKYRKYGNDFYNTKMSDDRIHEKVWRFYTQSIALAPDDSPEMALGYGNRSALLFHLEKYEDCIKDCNRAMTITSCGYLKCKLLCRKAECLAILNKNTAKSVCDDALKQLLELTIKEELKIRITDKLHNILNTINISNSFKHINKSKDCTKIDDLNYQRETPCASNSIKINYSKQWRRHITATKDIKPGDIVAIENNFCTLLIKPGLYIFCSYCLQPAWSSIPCKYCIYDVYCSENCRFEAWKKYHEYECPVYPYIWDIDENITDGHSAIRLLLIMIYNAGGIERLKKTVNDVEKCKDLRTKGFSSDGIFHSNHPSGMYSQMCGDNKLVNYTQIYEACINVHLLATKTNLFGKKMDLDASDMSKNDDILFVGALLTRIHSVLQQHSLLLTHDFGKEKVVYGMSFSAFNSFFNHSCNPNTELVSVKDNKTIIYAKHPIMKGEQLFISYRGIHYLSHEKEQRQKDLNKLFGFNCNCLACYENWSNICIPSSDIIFDVSPVLEKEYREMIDTIRKCGLITKEGCKYSLGLVKNLKFVLETFSEKMTVHCTNYQDCEKYLLKTYVTYFGNWTFDISHKCTSTQVHKA